jgi:hypothetical protein
MKGVYLKKIAAPKKLLKINFFFFLLLFGPNIFGQVSNYTFTQTSGTYSEISGGTVLGTATSSGYSTSALCDVVYSVTSLPFSFNFDGTSYTAFRVSTNGFITFGSAAPSTTNYNPLSSGETYNGAVAPWGGDLSGFVNIGGRTSQIRWQVTGSSPNREVVIQWKNMRPVATSIDFNVPYLSFQIRLKETSNIIECVYGPSGMAIGTPNSNAAQQVGLRGPNNTFPANINNRSNTTTVSINSSSAGTANNSEQRFSSVNATPGRHTDGKIYRWTPAAAAPAISSSVATLTSFTACSGSASSTQNFAVSGANMAAGITITPPVGFEVSTSSTFGSSVGTNASPLAIGAAGTIASTTIYARLLNTASGAPSGNITLTSTNASTQNVSVSGTVNSSSTAPISISGTTTICAGSTTLAAQGGSLGTGAGYQWYAGGCGSGTVLGTGSSLTVSPTSNTTYYLRISGTCNSTSCVNTTVTVNSSSTAPISISGTTTICSGSTTLAAQGGSLGSGASYQWYAGGCGSGSSLGSGSSISVSPTTSTTYYLRISGTCNTTSCVNTTVAVNSLSTVPSGITGTTAICSGNSTTLSASGGSLGAGASYQWFAGGCASGSSLGSGSSLSVSPTSNTSYFLRISGTCNTTSCVNQTVSVTDAPSAGTLSGNQTICPNGSTTFTTNGNIGGLWTSSNLGVATVNSNGSINGVTAGTATITYTVSGSGACNSATAVRNVNVSDITLTSNTNSGDFVWNGSTSNSWTNLSNWSVYNGVSIVNASIFPTQLDNVVLPMNNTCVVFQPTITANNDTIKSLKIESGATFTMSNSTLVVTGNWVQNGSFIPGNGNVIFKGSAAQSISGVGTILFSNVSINNSSSAINLLTPVEISTSLTMVSGNISTSTLNPLTLGIGAAGVLNWTSGTITGPFKRWFTNAANTGNSTGLFPVGTVSDNRWALLEYTSAPASAGYISAEFKAVNPLATSAGINGLPLIDQYNWSINNIATDGYWEIIPISAVGGTYNLKLRPKAFSLSNLYDVGRIIKSPNDHSTWVLNGNHGSINGSQTDFTISRIGMSGFSYFAIGYTNNAPLPVTLISFQANCIEDYTSINRWSTASESNSSYFQLEKSRDGINWQLLSVIEAAGNSTTKIDYEFFDLEKFRGVFYYRLKQFDFNGCEITYGPISVSCRDAENSMNVFPNPSNGDFTISSSEIGTFNIINELGQLVRTVEITEANGNQVKVEDMPNGAYFVTGTLNGNIVTKKVIVVR